MPVKANWVNGEDWDPAAANAVGAAINTLQTGKSAVGHTHTSDSITDLAEAVRDTIGATLVEGANVDIAVDDVANTITITSTGGVDAEAVRDTVAATLVDGTGIDITVDDVANTITITATGTAASRVADFGFCQSELGNQDWFTEAEIRDTLQGMKDAGATWVRFAAWWRGIEQTATAGAYTWTGTDRALNLIEEYGLKPLMCITRGGAPLLYTPTIVNFANLCGAIAGRYGAAGTDQCHHFEIWNEPNNVSHYAPFTASFGFNHYTDLLTAASTAIRAADANSFVIAGSLMSTLTFSTTDISPSDFLQGIYDEGGAAAFDAVSYHWYSGASDFSGFQEPTRDQEFYVELEATRAVMVAEGDTSKEIWITEMGFPITVEATQRANWLAQQIELVSDTPFVERWFIYNYRPGIEAESDPDSQFGTVNFDFTPKQPIYNYVASINAVVPAALTSGLDAWGITATATELNYVDGVTSAIQTQLAGKQPVATGTPTGSKFLRDDNSWATPAGGGGLTSYIGLVPAIAADGTATITHSLNNWNVDAVLTRSYLQTGALTVATPGEVITDIRWRKSGPNSVVLEPSVAIAANEFIIAVNPSAAPADVSGPTAGTLSSPSQTLTAIDLSLSGGADAGIGLAGVNWYRNGVLIGTTAGDTFSHTGLTSNTEYDGYTAKRFDYYGLEGAVSNTLDNTFTATPANVAPIGTAVQARSAASGTVTTRPTYASGSLRIAVAVVADSHAIYAASSSETRSVTGTQSGSWTQVPESALPDILQGSQQSGSVHIFYKISPNTAWTTDDVTYTVSASGVAYVNAMISIRQYSSVDQTTPFGTAVISAANSPLSAGVSSTAGDYTMCAMGEYNATPTGYNKTLVGSVQGAVTAGYLHYLLHGESATASTGTITHSTTGPSGNAYAAILANIRKA